MNSQASRCFSSKWEQVWQAQSPIVSYMCEGAILENICSSYEKTVIVSPGGSLKWQKNLRLNFKHSDFINRSNPKITVLCFPWCKYAFLLTMDHCIMSKQLEWQRCWQSNCRQTDIEFIVCRVYSAISQSNDNQQLWSCRWKLSNKQEHVLQMVISQQCPVV